MKEWVTNRVRENGLLSESEVSAYFPNHYSRKKRAFFSYTLSRENVFTICIRRRWANSNRVLQTSNFNIVLLLDVDNADGNFYIVSHVHSFFYNPFKALN